MPISLRSTPAWAAGALALCLGTVSTWAPTRADDAPAAAVTRLAAADVDAGVDARLTALKLRPAPLADDATFVRRATLDLTGTLPTPRDATAYLADRRSDKRERLVARLVASPAFAKHLARTETQRLLRLVTDTGGTAYYRAAFEGWLARGLRAGRGWDQIAGDLVAVEGTTGTDPATIYALDHARTSPEDMAGAVSRHFLGLRLACARCHDHPFAETTQAQFHGVAAYFARLRLRQTKPGVFRIGEAPVGEHRYTPVAGKRRASAPALLPSAPPSIAPGYAPARTTRTSRRAAFARWLTSPDNPWFARAAVNTAWSRLFGRGLVPADLAGARGEPFAPLLDRLARAFAQERFSLPRLYRTLASSRAYARAVTLPAGADLAQARDAFGAARVRPLPPDSLADALLRATGRDRPAAGELPSLHARLRRALVENLRRVVPSAVDGRAPDADQVTTANGLYLLNGRAPTGLIRGVGLTQVLTVHTNPSARLDALFLRTLSRRPRPAERSASLAHLERAQHTRAAWADLFWALIATSEFTTNH